MSSDDTPRDVPQEFLPAGTQVLGEQTCPDCGVTVESGVEVDGTVYCVRNRCWADNDPALVEADPVNCPHHGADVTTPYRHRPTGDHVCWRCQRMIPGPL